MKLLGYVLVNCILALLITLAVGELTLEYFGKLALVLVLWIASIPLIFVWGLYPAVINYCIILIYLFWILAGISLHYERSET